MGNPRGLYVADTIRCPILDRGSPRRTHGNAVSNPRIRVCQPSSRCRVSYFAHQLHDLDLVSDDGKDASCRIILKTNIRESSTGEEPLRLQSDTGFSHRLGWYPCNLGKNETA